MSEDFFHPIDAPKQWPLKLSLAGISHVDSSYRIERSRDLGLFVLEYVTNGRGIIETEKQRYEVGPGDLYIIHGYRDYCYYTAGNSSCWEKYWLNLNGPMISMLLKEFELEECYVCRNFPAPELFFDCWQELHNAPELAQTRIIPKYCMEILSTVAATLQSRSIERQIPSAIRKIKHQLDNQLTIPKLNLDHLAQQAKCSKISLLRQFRQAYQTTPYHYWLNRKLETAAEMLRVSAMSCKEIAANLSFSDQYHFSKLFTKRFGVSPSSFRNTNWPT